MKKAQASLEYMIMLAISLGVFAAILYVSTFLISTSTTQVGLDTAFRAVQTIREASDFIYIHGHPSKIQTQIRIPTNVEELKIANRSVKLSITSYNSYTDIYEVTKGNLTSDISLICPTTRSCKSGNYVFVFESLAPETGYDVNITTL
ncbi:MAG: hypothetical protein QXY62_02790 [Candidatus Altiarchaeota archaeon]